MDPSEKFLVSSRFWVQRVLVPILVMIGAGGNIITVMVLTQRRMRCSTNIYLTALAVADLVYLLFVLVLSFEHYPNINDISHALYWRFYGINHWLADAASSTSIWLVVCFTIERYIAICHPIRGKVLCTENRAKRVIAGVSLLCIFATISTTFEYQLTTKKICEQKECIEPPNKQTTDENETDIYVNITKSENELIKLLKRESNIPELLTIDDKQYYMDNCVNDTGQICSETNKKCQLLNENFICINETSLNNTSDDCCIARFEIIVESTNLGKNVTYRTIFYWFTSISFTFLPLALIATFNCFLVSIVHRSQKQRKQMTMSQENSSQSQEHRMTLILIAVVILFLICQTPTACILIYTSINPNLDEYTLNIVRGLGNIFNLLVSINAACNFLLYCALSDKYRRTFKALFCGRRITRHDTSISGISRYSNRTLSRSNANQRNGFRRNVSVYVPRNYETQCLNSIPRAKTVILRSDKKGSNGRLV